MLDLFVNSQTSQDDNDGGLAPFEESLSFSAATQQVAHLADAFAAITQISNHALMIIKPSGITIFAEYNHVSNVSVDIHPSLFSVYDCPASEMRLGIDVALISDAFLSVASVPATSTRASNRNNGAPRHQVNCFISYSQGGDALILEFEDDLMTEKLEFYTFCTDIEYPQDNDTSTPILGISRSDLQYELIIRADVFANLLQDAAQISTSELYMFVLNEKHTSSNENRLNFISRGVIGHSKLIFPCERTILEKLVLYDPENEVTTMRASFMSCYNFPTFIKILRAVKLATRCRILRDSQGVLSIQLLCKNPLVPTYTGTLITFNMLELATHDDIFDPSADPQARFSLNSMFDDDRYMHPTENALVGGPHHVAQHATQLPAGEKLSYAAFRQPHSNRPDLDRLQVMDSVRDRPAAATGGASKSHANGKDASDRPTVDLPLFL